MRHPMNTLGAGDQETRTGVGSAPSAVCKNGNTAHRSSFSAFLCGHFSFNPENGRGVLVLVRPGDLIYKVNGAWRSRSGKGRTAPNPSPAIQGCCHLVAGSGHAQVTGDIFPAGKFSFEVRSFLQVIFSCKEQGASNSASG